MSVQIIDCKQGTQEWFNHRLGIPTASRFKDVVSKGQGRKTYMMHLLYERLTGLLAQNVDNADMKRGREMESDARRAYCFWKDLDGDPQEITQIGMFKGNGVGYSPDGLNGDSGAHEIKCPRGYNHLNALVSDKVPSAHRWQLQGGLWLSEREWIDFISFSPPLPIFVKRVYRDEVAIKDIADACEKFNTELDKLEQKVRAMQ